MIAISYRREDTLPVAGRLYDRLEQRFGKNKVFMDFDSIRPGFDFRDQITDTIERSKVVVAVIGPDWLGLRSDGTRRIDEPNDFVRLEVACALERGIPVIPVMVNNTPMPKPETLPDDIQNLAFRHALPLDTGLDFRQHADRLAAAIQKLPRSPHIRVSKPSREKSTNPLPNEATEPEYRKSPQRLMFLWLFVGLVVIAGATAATWKLMRITYPEKRVTNFVQTTKLGGRADVSPGSSPIRPEPRTLSTAQTSPSLTPGKVSPVPTLAEQPNDSVKSAPIEGDQHLVVPKTAEVTASSPTPAQQHENTTLKFGSVTKERPYENSLEMRFVPIPGTQLLFSIWDTRVKDYEIFVRQTHRDWPKPSFSQTPLDPAVNVSWEDAGAFCEWLTGKEEGTGRLTGNQRYQLPTDSEWSTAAGDTKYPWGNQWPPPKNSGNYSPSLHVDNYQFTSPVGNFPPNSTGLYDMGGNVWQWCQNWYRKEMNSKAALDRDPDLKNDSGGKTLRVVRGGSYFVGTDIYLQSSIRVGGATPKGRNPNNGFRSVLTEAEASPTNLTARGDPQLIRVSVKKYGASMLFPTDVFPDAAKLSNSDTISIKGVSWSGRTVLTFSEATEPLVQVYAASEKGRKIDYKVLREDWFAVSGDAGIVDGAQMGFYIKGVKKGDHVITMTLQYQDDDFPMSDETFNAMVRSFTVD